MRIDQLTAGFSRGDAISEIVLGLQKLFWSWAHRSEVYSIPHFTSPKLRGRCRDYRAYKDSGDRRDVLVFHFSTGGELVGFFRKLNCRKVLFYHNMTPPEYYVAVDAGAARRLEEGYAKLESLRETVDLVVTVSEFNKSCLEASGYRNVKVVPPLVDFESLEQEPDSEVLQKYSDNVVNILFVGRVVPNKKFEDLIRTFYFYHKTIEPRSRLLLVGSYAGMGRYFSYLTGLVGELDARGVVFAGHVDFRELLAYYHLADVFLCMSEHEGFCIPLLEAMHLQVPVIAYRAAAVPETLAGASVVVNKKEPELIAEMIQEVVRHGAFREEVIRRQNLRLADFSRETVSEQVQDLLKTLVRS
jgi:glycosyltransferase involved in cell wall biosynthesis